MDIIGCVKFSFKFPWEKYARLARALVSSAVLWMNFELVASNVHHGLQVSPQYIYFRITTASVLSSGVNRQKRLYIILFNVSKWFCMND